MEVLEDHAIRNCQSDGQRGEKMAEGIDKRSWWREPPALGLSDYRFNFDDPVRTSSFALHFSYAFTTRTTALLCFVALYYDDTISTFISTSSGAISDCVKRSCQGYDWGGIIWSGTI